MLKKCDNLECWKFPIATEDDFCNECFYPTTWASSLDTSGSLLISTTTNLNNELPQSHTSACFQSSSCEPPNNLVLTAFNRPDTLLGVSLYDVSTPFPTTNGGTILAAVAEDTKHPLRDVLDQPSPLTTLPFLHYNPQAENSGKDKTRRSCTSCYNRRKCINEEGQLCCKYCASKSIYCKGPIYIPPLIETQSWFSTAIAAPANASKSLDAMLLNGSSFSLQVSLDESMHSTRQTVIETKPSTLDAQPIMKSYPVDLRALRDNAPSAGDVTKLDEILDMIFPNVKRTVSTNPSLGPESLASFERHCRRFLACIMPLRLPKSCMLGSRLWKNPASSYIMFEFLRQLGHKACALFRKLFKDLVAFLESPRNKRQFSRQISFVAFNLGLIHKGVESLGGGQEEWSNLLRLPNPYAVAPSALAQLKFLGNSFDVVSFVAGCDDEPADLPSIYITLVSAKGQPISQAKDTRYSFIEILAQCSSPLDGKAAEERSKISSIEEQQNLFNKVQLELSDLQMQIQGERKRHKARMTELEMERHAKLRVVDGLHLANNNPSFASIEARMKREKTITQHTKHDNFLLYSMPQPSPVSDATTLVELEDTSSIDEAINPTPSDAELELDTTTFDAQSPDQELVRTVGNSRSHPNAPVKHLATHRLDGDCAQDNDFPNTRNLSKRKRISGYLSLKKQRLAASPTIQHGRHDATDKTPVAKPTKLDLSLASSLGGPTGTDLTQDCTSNDHVQRDHKQEDLKIISTNRAHRSSGQPLKNRPSWILAGRVFAVQGKKVACTDTINQILITDSDRPASWPRSRRWRKSIGISVKALTDGFEKLAVAQVIQSAPV